MKKTIFIEISLILSFAVLLTFTCLEFMTLYYQIQFNDIPKLISRTVVLSIIALLATLADLAAMVLIALRDIPKLKAWVERRKTARADAKAEKAEADKQARIAALQAELDQLKKDE